MEVAFLQGPVGYGIQRVPARAALLGLGENRVRTAGDDLDPLASIGAAVALARTLDPTKASLLKTQIGTTRA